MMRVVRYTTTTPEHVGRINYNKTGGSLPRETMTLTGIVPSPPVIRLRGREYGWREADVGRLLRLVRAGRLEGRVRRVLITNR